MLDAAMSKMRFQRPRVAAGGLHRHRIVALDDAVDDAPMNLNLRSARMSVPPRSREHTNDGDKEADEPKKSKHDG
jgi:hypothetical protein